METVIPETGKSTLTNEETNVQDDSAFKDSTEAELTKIRLMRTFVEARDPSSKYFESALTVGRKISLTAVGCGETLVSSKKVIEVDDLMIRRFLRARDLDVDKASTMFLKYWKWRNSFVPNGCVSPSEIPDDIAQEKMYVQGVDKKGRPITVAFAAKHFQTKNGLDAFKRYVVFALEKLCSRMPAGEEKFLAIADIKGWGYANSDLRGYLNALTILQDYYPERLGKLFIVHAPYMFMKVWKIVYPFIDDNTKKKIVFVENKKLKSTLLEEIDESQLPEIYGGRLQLVPIQDS